MPPLFDVALHDRSTLIVVTSNTKLGHSVLGGHTQLLIYLVLDGQTMTVPAKAAHDVTAFHGPITGHNVLNRARHQVSVMRQPRRKGWSVVKDERLFALGFFQRLFKSIGFLP